MSHASPSQGPQGSSPVAAIPTITDADQPRKSASQIVASLQAQFTQALAWEALALPAVLVPDEELERIEVGLGMFELAGACGGPDDVLATADGAECMDWAGAPAGGPPVSMYSDLLTEDAPQSSGLTCSAGPEKLVSRPECRTPPGTVRVGAVSVATGPCALEESQEVEFYGSLLESVRRRGWESAAGSSASGAPPQAPSPEDASKSRGVRPVPKPKATPPPCKRRATVASDGSPVASPTAKAAAAAGELGGRSDSARAHDFLLGYVNTAVGKDFMRFVDSVRGFGKTTRPGNEVADAMAASHAKSKYVLRKLAFSLIFMYIECVEEPRGRKRYFLRVPDRVLAEYPEAMRLDGFKSKTAAKQFFVRDLLGIDGRVLPKIDENKVTTDQSYLLLQQMYKVDPLGIAIPPLRTRDATVRADDESDA